MTRKRIRHELISNESRRIATLGRRANGLLKKAEEFSTLCGVEVGIIILHKQEEEGEADAEAEAEGEGDGNGEGSNNNNNNPTIIWPSLEIFKERLDKFNAFPPAERTRKMVTNEKIIEQLVASETESLLKAKEIVGVKESRQLLSQIIQGKTVDEFDSDQLNCLNLYSATMLEKLEKREAELINKQQPKPPQPEQQFDVQPMQPFDVPTLGNEASTSVFGTEPISPTTRLIQNLSNDQWFIESMSEEQNRISRGDNSHDQ